MNFQGVTILVDLAPITVPDMRSGAAGSAGETAANQRVSELPKRESFSDAIVSQAPCVSLCVRTPIGVSCEECSAMRGSALMRTGSCAYRASVALGARTPASSIQLRRRSFSGRARQDRQRHGGDRSQPLDTTRIKCRLVAKRGLSYMREHSEKRNCDETFDVVCRTTDGGYFDRLR